jgi:hypothetical protein
MVDDNILIESILVMRVLLILVFRMDHPVDATVLRDEETLVDFCDGHPSASSATCEPLPPST